MNLQKLVQDDKLETTPRKPITRQEAFDAFVVQQETQLAQMDKVMKNQAALEMMQSQGNEEQQQELMILMLVEQCRSIDIMWMKTGIDQADLEEAISEHKLHDDPEFRQKT
mmetsp:Transcript_40669/g.62020  ORF Transcript_40669/g.62020 Transcript_40669/m.62020 type:complete len:111 (+) Transcript_40669:581-913(+)